MGKISGKLLSLRPYLILCHVVNYDRRQLTVFAIIAHNADQDAIANAINFEIPLGFRARCHQMYSANTIGYFNNFETDFRRITDR
jgi:hypothetical protein